MSTLWNPNTLDYSGGINSRQEWGSAKEFGLDTWQIYSRMKNSTKLTKSQNFIHLHKPHCPPYLGSKVVCWCCLLSASNWGFCMVLSCIRQAWSWARFATCKYTGASTFCCIDHVFTTFAWKIVRCHSININARTWQVMQQSGHQPQGWPFHVLYQPHVALQLPINLCRCLSKRSQTLTVTAIAVCLIICSSHWKFIWMTLRNTWRLFFPYTWISQEVYAH